MHVLGFLLFTVSLITNADWDRYNRIVGSGDTAILAEKNGIEQLRKDWLPFYQNACSSAQSNLEVSFKTSFCWPEAQLTKCSIGAYLFCKTKPFSAPVGLGKDYLVTTYNGSIGEDDFLCIGNKKTGEVSCQSITPWPLPEPRNFRNLTKIAVGVSVGGIPVACALHDSKITCWSNRKLELLHSEESIINVPQIEQPADLVISASTACAVGVKELKCWGGEYQLLKPTAVTAGKYVTLINTADSNGLCIVDANGAKCGSALANSTLKPVQGVPEDIIQLTSGLNMKCALREQGAYCWDYYFWGPSPEVQNNAVEIQAGSRFGCAIVRETGKGSHISCFGKSEHFPIGIPEVEDPHSLSISAHDLCVVDAGKLLCTTDY